MGEDTTIKLQKLHGKLGDVVYELTKVQFSHFSLQKGWQPAINGYRCHSRFAICVDLAGVKRSVVDLRIEPRRLIIRGRRPPPEPAGASQQPLEVLAMEIDYGPFEREIHLPLEVEPERVETEQENGLLWIYLPLRPEA